MQFTPHLLWVQRVREVCNQKEPRDLSFVPFVKMRKLDSTEEQLTILILAFDSSLRFTNTFTCVAVFVIIIDIIPVVS